MTSQIQIFDDFLTNEELEECLQFTNKPAWAFGVQSDPQNPISTQFWIMKLTNESFFNICLLSKIERAANKKFELARVYANGQTFGQDGTFHQDEVTSESYTFCLYVNKQVTVDTAEYIGGDIMFKLPANSEDGLSKIQSSLFGIETIYNRGILFPSNFFHKGLAFNRYNKGIRISIVWKLKVK
jgi:hypothetical protein